LTPLTACMSQCLSLYFISLWEVAAGKPRNVHKAFKPETKAETEVLNHKSEASHISVEVRPRQGIRRP